MQKGIGLAPAAGRDVDVPRPTAERADEILSLARALGYGRRELAALFEVLDQMATERREAA